jgi:hypothetical protein
MPAPVPVDCLGIGIVGDELFGDHRRERIDGRRPDRGDLVARSRTTAVRLIDARGQSPNHP